MKKMQLWEGVASAELQGVTLVSSVSSAIPPSSFLSLFSLLHGTPSNKYSKAIHFATVFI